MPTKYKLLSYSLDTDTPLYGSTPPVRIAPDRQIKEGDSCNTALIGFQNHSGTHIDASRHFFNDGKRISDFSIGELIFQTPYLIDCPKKPDELVMPEDLAAVGKCDLLLIRTGFCRVRKSVKYRKNNPGISAEAAKHIRIRHPYIKAVGIDSISISAFQNRLEGRLAHRILLQKRGFTNEPVFIIEDMDLRADLKNLKKVFAVPLFIEKADSAPCTVIGEFRE